MNPWVRHVMVCIFAAPVFAAPFPASGATVPSPTTDPAPQVAALPADATIDTVLDALNARGKNFSDLTADVRLSDINGDTGVTKTHIGHLWLQARAPGDDTLHVVFDRVTDGRFSRPDKHEYLLDGSWLTDRDYHAKSEVKRQVLKPGQKLNLFKLGEGSFPLPIGQDKADVHRDFDVTLVKLAAAEPKDTIHVMLVPHAKTSLARRFSQIDVWVDRATDMPVRIDTLDEEKVVQESTELQNIKINTPGGLQPPDLSLQNIDQNGWTIAPPEPYKQ